MLLLDIFAPPVGVTIWWLMSKGLQMRLGTTNDSVVAGWTKSLGWFLLIAVELMFWGGTVYAYWISPYKGPMSR
jgi:hypothetical protein